MRPHRKTDNQQALRTCVVEKYKETDKSNTAEFNVEVFQVENVEDLFKMMGLDWDDDFIWKK
jgi:hypothetical protein